MKQKFNLKDYTANVNFEEYAELKPKEAIMTNCLQCCSFDEEEVLKCDIKTCPLNILKTKWFKRKRVISHELRETRSRNLKTNRF